MLTVLADSGYVPLLLLDGPHQKEFWWAKAENVKTYLWGSRTVKHHYCAGCGCGTYSESPDWSTGKPDFDNPKVAVNARLFDDFDLDAVPINLIDGKNLW